MQADFGLLFFVKQTGSVVPYGEKNNSVLGDQDTPDYVS